MNSADLHKRAGFTGKLTKLASYISRDLRKILRPIVESHGPAAGIDDPQLIGCALICSERKSYQSTFVPTGYSLAVPLEKIQYIHGLPAVPAGDPPPAIEFKDSIQGLSADKQVSFAEGR